MTNEHWTHSRMSAADRQRQLLEIAMSAFSRRGFKGTTTKEIAAAAGVAEAVIFQHFPSKEALYSAVLDLHLDANDEAAWIEQISDLMERNDDEEVFRSFVTRILRSYRCDPEIERVILFAALEGHEQGMTRLRKQFAPIFERLMAYVTRRQREGALIECDPHAVLVCVGAAAHQYGLITQIFGAPTPQIADEEMANLFTRILLHGIQSVPSSKKKTIKEQKPANKSKRKAKS
jgi:TetR/AcrR family transcriptional regulator